MTAILLHFNFIVTWISLVILSNWKCRMASKLMITAITGPPISKKRIPQLINEESESGSMAPMKSKNHVNILKSMPNSCLKIAPMANRKGAMTRKTPKIADFRVFIRAIFNCLLWLSLSISGLAKFSILFMNSFFFILFNLFLKHKMLVWPRKLHYSIKLRNVSNPRESNDFIVPSFFPSISQISLMLLSSKYFSAITSWYLTFSNFIFYWLS